MNAATALSESRIYIDDTPALPVLQFQASARRLHSHDPLSLIVVDYLQLMRAPTRAKENRQVEVMEISNGIKALAKELRVPVIALAQINRNPDARSGGDNGKPVLSDLRESGTIEQDADIVGLLWRKEYYAGDEEEKAEAGNAAELRIAKHRNGPTGDIPLSFEKSITRFSDREGDGEK
jgi:replicative DNA helicase